MGKLKEQQFSHVSKCILHSVLRLKLLLFEEGDIYMLFVILQRKAILSPICVPFLQFCININMHMWVFILFFVLKLLYSVDSVQTFPTFKNFVGRIPGWVSSLAPAFGPGHDPRVPGLSPTSGSQHGVEPAFPSACVSAPLFLCVSHE